MKIILFILIIKKNSKNHQNIENKKFIKLVFKIPNTLKIIQLVEDHYFEQVYHLEHF